MSAPVEFRTDLVWEQNKTSGGQAFTPTWSGTIGIDLRWVASAKPYLAFGYSLTTITLAGSAFGEHNIDISYPDFMRMWTTHMEARTP